MLGNENAYEILNLLRDKEYSGIMIANIVGIKAPLATYYLKKLQEYNLAEVVRTKKNRGATEKFYRATARKFLISTDVGETEESISQGLSNSYINHLMHNLVEYDSENIVDLIVDDYLKVCPDERVMIVYHEYNMEFAKKLIIKARRTGAKYRTSIRTKELSQDLWSSLPIKRVKGYYDQISEDIDWADIWINLGRYSKPEFSGIPQQRIERIAAIRDRAMSKLSLNSEKRGLMLYIPPFEKSFFEDRDIIERVQMYLKALSLDKSDFKKVKSISELILDKPDLRIESGQHNVLQVKFDKDCYFIDAGPYTESSRMSGFYSLPSGELGMLPIEGGINGDIYCEYCDRRIGEISGIRLRIKDNIVIDVKADKGLEILQSLFDSFGVEGRTVSQVCFGMNSAITDVLLLPEMSSKKYGSIHITFGNNAVLGGTIKEPNTWSLISISPCVKSDTGLIMADGKFDIQ